MTKSMKVILPFQFWNVVVGDEDLIGWLNYTIILTSECKYNVKMEFWIKGDVYTCQIFQ